jgi:cell division protein FtsQ
MATFACRRRSAVLVVAVALAVLAPLALWLRSSSLVRVSEVVVTGVHGPQAAEIRVALADVGREMTTLTVRDEALLSAVEPYSIVRSLRTETDFPHRLRITINAYEPVAALQTPGGRLTAVAGDGTLLRGGATRGVAVVGVKAAASGDRVRDAPTLRAIELLAAAPAPLRARVARVFGGRRGLALTVRAGPKLYFGGAARFEAKWGAAAAVLSHGSARGASYVDLSVPERPVAGGMKPRPAEAEPQL